jgi:hypothetical protein
MRTINWNKFTSTMMSTNMSIASEVGIKITMKNTLTHMTRIHRSNISKEMFMFISNSLMVFNFVTNQTSIFHSGDIRGVIRIRNNKP